MQIHLAQYTFYFLETLKVEMKAMSMMIAELKYFGDLENIQERDTLVFSTVVTY